MICHHFECVFVHVPKTAGQSIEHVFLSAVGLTWDTRAPLLLRANPTRELGPPWLAHLTAAEYVEYRYLPERMFRSYFKFGFVRNPWDRVVSFYRYLGYGDRCDFKTFLFGPFMDSVWSKKHWFVRPQVDFLYDGASRCLVDFVGRFEALDADFSEVCARVGLPRVRLPLVNQSAKREGEGAARDFRRYYDRESADRVGDLYSADIEAFGYRFEDPRTA